MTRAVGVLLAALVATLAPLVPAVASAAPPDRVVYSDDLREGLSRCLNLTVGRGRSATCQVRPRAAANARTARRWNDIGTTRS